MKWCVYICLPSCHVFLPLLLPKAIIIVDNVSVSIRWNVVVHYQSIIVYNASCFYSMDVLSTSNLSSHHKFFCYYYSSLMIHPGLSFGRILLFVSMSVISSYVLADITTRPFTIYPGSSSIEFFCLCLSLSSHRMGFAVILLVSYDSCRPLVGCHGCWCYPMLMLFIVFSTYCWPPIHVTICFMLLYVSDSTMIYLMVILVVPFVLLCITGSFLSWSSILYPCAFIICRNVWSSLGFCHLLILSAAWFVVLKLLSCTVSIGCHDFLSSVVIMVSCFHWLSWLYHLYLFRLLVSSAFVICYCFVW